MSDAFDSNVMKIEIVGSTIRYAYLDNVRRAYELRGVASSDLAALRLTNRNDRYSSSATVHLLTQKYRETHHHAGDGTSAKPCSIPKQDLILLTPFTK